MRHPLWWLRHHLPLRKRWDNKTFTTGLRPRENMPNSLCSLENHATALTGEGNAPLSPPTAVLPPEGEVCSPLSFYLISTLKHSAAKTSPSGGGAVGRRGAFPSGRRPGWFVFPSRQGRGCKGFIIRGVLNELKDANYRRASGMYNSSPPKVAIPQPSARRAVVP